MSTRRTLLVLPCVALALVLVAPPATASHSWGKYHWARTSNPFTLAIGDNVSSKWDTHLRTASTDWSRSNVLDTTVVAGNGSNCSPTAGRVEACNGNYGNNGWLGIARIWTTRGSHIVQGLVQLNDYYFDNFAYYDTSWRTYVMCQEVGHTLGLDHVDENFDNTTQGTCMDYTDPLTAADLHPNAHDYDQLGAIYAHADRLTTVGSAAAGAPASAPVRQDQWGQAIRFDSAGRPSMFALELGEGRAVYTFVTWA